MAVPVRTGDVGSSSFVQFRPPADVADAVACTWVGRTRAARSLRVLPDACVDLVWDGVRLLATGPATGPVRHEVHGTSIGLRLRPGAARSVLDRNVDAVSAAGVEVPVVRPERLADAASDDARRAVLVDLVRQRLRMSWARDDQVRRMLAALRTAPDRRMDRIADDVGLSARHQRRRFVVEVGLTPRSFARVVRFGRVRARLADLASGAATVAAVAADCGYADQAHLSREARRLSGQSPLALAGCWAGVRNVHAEPGRGG